MYWISNLMATLLLFVLSRSSVYREVLPCGRHHMWRPHCFGLLRDGCFPSPPNDGPGSIVHFRATPTATQPGTAPWVNAYSTALC